MAGAVNPCSPFLYLLTLLFPTRLCPRAFQTNSFVPTIIVSYRELECVFYNMSMKWYVFLHLFPHQIRPSIRLFIERIAILVVSFSSHLDVLRAVSTFLMEYRQLAARITPIV